MENVAALILGPNEGKEDEEEAEGDGDEYESVAAEIILGIDKRDPEIVAKGLKAFFALCDASPHVEGEHVEGE